MKKIIKLFIFTILLVVFGSSNVLAEEFNGVFEKSEIINDIYYYKHRNDTEEIKYPTHNFHEQAYIYRDTIKHNYVYCIESWKHLTGARPGDYQVYSTNHSLTNLSDEMMKRINLIAYYGYGYVDDTHDHTSLEWYAFSQMLIWRHQAPQYEHYFVDSEGSTMPVTSYEKYLDEIEELVNNHYLKPTIQETIDTYANDIITLNDNNNVLNYYEIVNDNKNIKAHIDGNKLIIDSNYYTGTYNLKLIRNNSRFNKNMQIYTSENFQNVLEPGDEEPIELNLTINVKPHKLKFAYMDEIFLEEYFDDSMHVKSEQHLFENIEFDVIAEEDIRDKEGRLLALEEMVFATFTTSNNYSEIELPAGKYIIKQKTKIPGYKMEEINVKVYQDTTEIIYGTRQKPCINIVKKKELVDKNGSSYYVPGEDIEIGIYAAEDIYNYLGGIFAKKDTLLYKYKTDERGKIITVFPELQPGHYYFKEISEIEGYEKNEEKYPFIFEYSEDFEELYIPEETTIYNNLIKTKLIIYKKEEGTWLGLGGVEFTLYEYKTSIELYKGTTDSSGKLILYLPTKKYSLRETKTLEGYVKDTRVSLIALKENEDYYLTVFNKKIEEEEPNKEPIDDNENKDNSDNKIDENENKDPDKDKTEESNNEEPKEEQNVESDNKELNEDKIDETENKEPDGNKEEDSENGEPDGEKTDETENNGLIEKLPENELTNGIIESNNKLEEIELIVEVPKTEKNDYLLYLVIALGLEIVFLKWRKKV